MRRYQKITGVLAAGALALAAQSALAAGGGGGGSSGGGSSGGGGSAPETTQTTKDCFTERQWDPEIRKYVRYSKKVNGVWDPKERKCIRPDKAGYLDSNLLEDAVRELAYAGRNESAQLVLAQMDQSSDLVMTYWGFTHRKLGDLEAANTYYTAAIKKNPDNILARSYMGQGFVAEGDFVAALAELREIRARGGSDTWAEVSLLRAIETGTGYDY